MDDLSDLTANYNRIKLKLPKLPIKKIDEANQFIHQPGSALKNIMETTIYDNNKGSRTTRAEREPKKNIIEEDEKNYKLGLIAIKMRKYKPINGSHSRFYADLLMMGSNRTKNPNQDLSISPRSPTHTELTSTLTSPSHNLSSSPKKTKKLHTSIPTYKQGSTIGILNKLKQIQESSGQLRQNSRHLLKKADSACSMHENTYQRLRQDSKLIVNGEDKYLIAEEFKLELAGRRTINVFGSK